MRGYHRHKTFVMLGTVSCGPVEFDHAQMKSASGKEASIRNIITKASGYVYDTRTDCGLISDRISRLNK